jgi:hypothetical protein
MCKKAMHDRKSLFSLLAVASLHFKNLFSKKYFVACSSKLIFFLSSILNHGNCDGWHAIGLIESYCQIYTSSWCSFKTIHFLELKYYSDMRNDMQMDEETCLTCGCQLEKSPSG